MDAERIAISRGVAVILLLSSVVTVFLGMALLLMYEGSVADYHAWVFYPALYVGVLDLFACALCFVGGVALSKRRFFPLTFGYRFLVVGFRDCCSHRVEFRWLNMVQRLVFWSIPNRGFAYSICFSGCPKSKEIVFVVVLYPPPTGGRIAKTSPVSNSVCNPLRVEALFPLTKNWRKLLISPVLWS